MKEINPIKQDEVKLHAEKQVEKKTVFIGSETLRSGHRCFEINITTLQTKEAEYQKIVNFNSHDKRTILVKPNCVYVNALNKENALKVYKKGGRPIQAPIMTKEDLKFYL